MATLSKKEKRELLGLVHSPKLKKDFRTIKKNRRLFSNKETQADLDKYMKFLAVCGAFVNHMKKPLRRMDGDNFKI